ncbi:MAG: cation transporter [Nitrospinota bacterium]|nr:MAG: cation transporter [Nitrospinota bacterium]
MKRHQDCHVDPLEKPVDLEALRRAKIVTLLIRGMGCGRCALRVRNSLLLLPGVLTADIDLYNGLAEIAYDPSQADIDALVGAVAAAGGDGRHSYSVEGIVFS